MRNFIRFAFLAFLIAIVSCNNPPAAESPTTSSESNSDDIENGKAEISKQAAAFEEEFKRGDSNALAAHYSQDARLMPPNNEPVKGNDIAPFWGGAIRMGVKDVNLNITDISGNGDWLNETGTYEMYGDNNAVLDKGKYVVVWKNENGGWKMYRDIWNSSIPANAPK